MAKRFEEFLKEATDFQYFTGKNTVSGFSTMEPEDQTRAYSSDDFKKSAVDFTTSKVQNNLNKEKEEVPELDVNLADDILSLHSFDEFNENNNKSFEDLNLSLEDLKEIASYLEVWMQTDHPNFDMTKIDRVIELLKDTKYIVTSGDIYRLMLFDINKTTNDDGSLNIDKTKQLINVDDKYYSYTKSLADVMYLYWSWQEIPEIINKGGNYGIVIKQPLEQGLDVTNFNRDAYRYIMDNYKDEKDLVSIFMTFMMLEDQGEEEIISKKNNSFEIEGVIVFDQEHSKDHSNSLKIKSYDDFENDADLFFYKPDQFKLD